MYKSHYGFGLNRDDDNDIAVSRGFSKILRYCLIEAKEKNSVYLDEILKAFTEVVENAPEFEIGRFFAYPMLAGAITVAKKTEHLWNAIREDIRVKLELIMELFLYIGAHATHNLNNYKTGFKNKGGWNKHWNPNHKFAVKGFMCYVLEYYNDIETIDAKLAAFNFDDVITRIQEAGFTRCYNLWTAPAEQLDEDLYTQTVRERFEVAGECFIKDAYGNVYSGGYGEPITTPYYMYSKNDFSKNPTRTINIPSDAKYLVIWTQDQASTSAPAIEFTPKSITFTYKTATSVEVYEYPVSMLENAAGYICAWAEADKTDRYIETNVDGHKVAFIDITDREYLDVTLTAGDNYKGFIGYFFLKELPVLGEKVNYAEGYNKMVELGRHLNAGFIFNYLIADCYPAIPCESKIDVEKDGVMDAYILDGTTSPLEGQLGMFREFKCGSGAGVNRRFRSSLWFCMEDYIQASALLAYYNMFIANFAEEHSSIYPRVKVGNADLMYKIEHGYVGQANGRFEKTYPKYGFKNNSEVLAWKETLERLA